MASNNEDKNLYSNLNSSAMTPSIIHTINNTSPTPPTNSNNNHSNNNNNNHNNHVNTISKTKRPVEIYESYIEDSFVGHWEREDDDPDNPYNDGNQKVANSHDTEEDDSALHPSTIEFDFDSFGPESFIYTPIGSSRIANGSESNVQSSSSENKQEEEVKNVSTKTVSQEIPSGQSVVDTSNTPVDQIVEIPQIDLKVIEPYRKVISHAGYCHHLDPTIPAPNPGEPEPAIIVFSACYLPDRSRRDYNYVMDHLFLYVLSSLHELIADDYILIYLHNAQPSTTTANFSAISAISSNILGNAPNSSTSTDSASSDDVYQNNLPTFTWMKRCYQMIDRKLRKNLKILYLVKPTFWLKTIVIMCKPFISAKFSKKLRFVDGMNNLRKCLPVDKLILPASAENL